MGIFFHGFASADVFNNFARVLMKLDIVMNMYAHYNGIVGFASEDAHMYDPPILGEEPFAVEVW